MGSSVAGLDATVVNVALPAIEEELGGGLAGQQWVSNGYLLAVGNMQTLAMYGGLSITFFFLVLFLQQVAGYDALQAGIATAALVALGGVLSLVGIVNPRREVSAAGCAGGQLVGMPEEVALVSGPGRHAVS